MSAMSSFDPFSDYHFPVFDPGFPIWDCLDSLDPNLVFQEPETELKPVVSPQDSPEPVLSNLDTSNSGSVHLNSGSDERKKRRMLSNRESARRSRMRKQKHLENLRNQVNRLKVENREMMNRVRVVTHQTQYIRTDNERLDSESSALRQRLWDIRQVLLVRQLQQQISQSTWPPCNNFTPINEQNLPPLTT